MSDSLSTNPVRGADAPDDADREARIEQLLLLGLDHYFAGHYEHAISVWTRVVFLERHHDRARAYIERARSALAERHRETEELLHTGVSAYNAGEVEKARELLTRAGDQGSDTAHIFLDRLNRVGATPAAADLRIDPLPARSTAPRPPATLPPPRTGWTAAALFAVIVAVAMLVGGLPIGSRLSELEVTAPAPTTQTASDEPLPVVRASETAVARARDLYAGGHLRDALRVLDRVDTADPLRAEADRLRSDIQRDLLAAAGIATLVPAAPGEQP
jgi:tetratricopeptide (TPR) repeat protein